MARQAQGVQIADLAASMKVLPRKLELLEADRYDELLDATFTRTLALAVCRSLKIDSAPVLAMLPKPLAMQLEKHQSTLNAPFQERTTKSSRLLDSKVRGPGLLLQVWLPVLLILGAAAVYWMPADFLAWRAWQPVLPTETTVIEPTPEVAAINQAVVDVPAAAAASEPSQAASQAAPTESAPVPAPMNSQATALAVTSADPAAAVPEPLLDLQVRGDSWIEVRDGSGNRLLGRRVEAPESIALNGSLPLRLTIGNASHTTVRFRGELIDLLPMTRNNVARLELK
jgi:cytoskeleton protein RodZ